MIIKFSYWVHVKTETLNDREQYYKILEIGMDQFGLKMEFLWILQVSRIVFVLKLNSIIISRFLLSLGLRVKNWKVQGPGAKYAETQTTELWTAG
jgi:hypothetical protein